MLPNFFSIVLKCGRDYDIRYKKREITNRELDFENKRKRKFWVMKKKQLLSYIGIGYFISNLVPRIKEEKPMTTN